MKIKIGDNSLKLRAGASTDNIDRGPRGYSAYEVAVQNGYTGTEEEWLSSLVGPRGQQGPQGETGPANTLSIGTVRRGDDASATITGDTPNQVLNLVLPKGDKGDPGEVQYGSDLLSYMRRNSNQIYYPDLDSKPNFSITTANFDDTTRNIVLGGKDVTLSDYKVLISYGIANFVLLDLSPYKTSTKVNQLHPYTQLPNGTYFVTGQGNIYISNAETYGATPGEIIYKDRTALVVIGLYGCVYYGYNTDTEEYEGGYFTTEADVQYMLEDYQKGYTVIRQTSATGGVTINNGRWYKRTHDTGVTSSTFSLVNTLSEIPDDFKARVTLRTATTFTTFTITQRDAYKLYFMGDDCANGVITGVANKYYDIEFKADGFGDVVGIVHSYELPSA